MSKGFVTEEEVEKALDWLRDNATAIGAAKERKIRAEHMLKHTKAIVMKQHSELGIGAQEREAIADMRYVAAIDEEAKAAGDFEKMLALREAAALKIEVWRTMGANYRSMKI